MERIVIETDAKTKQKLKILAVKEGRYIKDVLAEAIEQYLKRKS